MKKVNLYTVGKKETKEFVLPADIFSEKENSSLLTQAIRVYLDRTHFGFRKTKTRAEINRTTKKLYKQKGTGGARHGSKRAPIFVGGGVAHGPIGVKRILKLSKNLKRKALKLTLSMSINKIAVISGLSNIKKTKEANNFVFEINKGIKPSQKLILLVLKDHSTEIKQAFKNLENIKIVLYSQLNALDVYNAGMILFEENCFLEEKKAKKGKANKS